MIIGLSFTRLHPHRCWLSSFCYVNRPQFEPLMLLIRFTWYDRIRCDFVGFELFPHISDDYCYPHIVRQQYHIILYYCVIQNLHEKKLVFRTGHIQMWTAIKEKRTEYGGREYIVESRCATEEASPKLHHRLCCSLWIVKVYCNVPSLFDSFYSVSCKTPLPEDVGCSTSLCCTKYE